MLIFFCLNLGYNDRADINNMKFCLNLNFLLQNLLRISDSFKIVQLFNIEIIYYLITQKNTHSVN